MATNCYSRPMASRLFALFLATAAVGCGGAPARGTVVATVDLQRALNESQAGQRERGRLQMMFRNRQSQLDERQEQLRAERDRIEAERQRVAEGSDEAAQLQDDFEKYRRDLAALQAEYQGDQEELQTAENRATHEIISRMATLVHELAEQRGIDIVIEHGEGGIVSTSTRAINLTDDVVRAYDERYPEGASTPSREDGASPAEESDEHASGDTGAGSDAAASR